MALFKCQACGAPLEVKDVTDIAFCPYCGMKQTLPKDDIHSSPDAESLIKRAFMFLEDGEFEKANDYCDKVLDIEPENSKAYLAKCMADLRVKKWEQLIKSGVHLLEDKNYLKALKFSSGTLKATLSELAEKNDKAISEHRERINEASLRRKRDYDSGIQLMNEGSYHEAEIIFGKLPEDYSDTLSRYKECRYNQALICMENGQYDKALEILSEDFGKTPMNPERYLAYLEKEYHDKPINVERIYRSHLRRIESEGTYRKDLKNYRDSAEKIKECERMLQPTDQQRIQQKKHSGCMTLILKALILAIIITILVMYL